MFDCCNLKFSELRRRPVVDKRGQSIGRVSDFIVGFSENKLKLKSVVLAGSRKEEFIEAIGLKPNNDPVFELGCLDRVEQEIHLACERNSLKTLLDKDAVGRNEIKMSDLAKIKVLDSDKMKIGNVIDVWFDRSDKMWLVLGGGVIEETLEKIGALPDIDLLVPEEAIKEISKKEISLKWTKFQLHSNCEREYDKIKRDLSSNYSPDDARSTQIRVIGDPNRGFI